MSGILVIAEHRDGELRDCTWEAVSAGLSLRQNVTAVLLASEPGLAEPFKGRSPSLRLLLKPELAEYNPEHYLPPVEALIRETAPALVLMGHTSQGMDLAPAMAGRMGLPLVTECTSVQTGDGKMTVTRPAYGGKVVERLVLKPSPTVILTLQGGAFEPASEGRFDTQVQEDRPEAADPRHLRRFVERIKAVVEEVDITAADILVSVGRGIGAPDNIPLAQALADRLGATLSCSRPVADAGWLPKSRQVGTSGQTVRPKVYLALGISGAFQHVAGMGGAEVIIAVNKDPRAPIFQVADYGLVADLFQVLPQLTELMEA